MTSLTLSKCDARPNLLRRDARGRVRACPERRELLLAEFDRSGVIAAVFATNAGVRCLAFAGWFHVGRNESSPAHTADGASGESPSWEHWMLSHLFRFFRLLGSPSARLRYLVKRATRDGGTPGRVRGRSAHLRPVTTAPSCHLRFTRAPSRAMMAALPPPSARQISITARSSKTTAASPEPSKCHLPPPPDS